MDRPKPPGEEGAWGYTLEAFSKEVKRTPEDRIMLRDMPPGTVVEFSTLNSTYRFTITNPERGEGVITGGWYGGKQKRVTISGAKADQKTSMIVNGAIQNGMIVEINDPDVKPYLETTPIQTLFIEKPKTE